MKQKVRGDFRLSNEVENVKIGRFLRDEIHFEDGRWPKSEIDFACTVGSNPSMTNFLRIFCFFLKFFLSFSRLGNAMASWNLMSILMSDVTVSMKWLTVTLKIETG